MSQEILLYIAIGLVSLTSVYILISKDWRYCVGALAVQYIGVFILADASWPIEMAAVKMVAGWMAAAILGIAMTSGIEYWREVEEFKKFSPIFRAFTAAIAGLTIASLVANSDSWLSIIPVQIRWGSFILIGIGLLQLSLSSHPLRVFIALLSCLSGFEIIYAAVESSVLVTGLLAGVNIGLALVGAYLLVVPTMERS